MLGKILSKEDCKNCKFCCSFRRQSLWESPFKISAKYKTEDENEEIPCDFLDYKTGCTLSDGKKPFDCKIWPFRVMKDENEIFVTIATSCPAISKKDEKVLLNFLQSEILDKILDKLKENPQMIKPMHFGYKKILNITSNLYNFN